MSWWSQGELVLLAVMVVGAVVATVSLLLEVV